MSSLRFECVGGVALVLSLCAVQAAAAPSPPWEVWHDIASLARRRVDDRIVMSSSHCPDGCRYDRHSTARNRALRTDGDEQVIFEQQGSREELVAACGRMRSLLVPEVLSIGVVTEYDREGDAEGPDVTLKPHAGIVEVEDFVASLFGGLQHAGAGESGPSRRIA